MGKKRRNKQAATRTATGLAPAAQLPEPWSTPSSSSVDPDVFASVLSVDYPLLDVTLILTIISDYVAEDSLHANEGLIREQLGALEAQVVADAADAAESEPAVSERAPTLAAPLDSHSVGPSRPSSAFATASASGSTALTSVCDEPLDEETGPQSEAELLALFFPNLKQKDITGALAAEPSLDAAVDHLLSIELIRGVEVSGTWGDEPHGEDEGEWVPMPRGSRRGSETSSAAATCVPRRGSSGSGSSSTLSVSGPASATLPRIGKKKKTRGTTLPIVDTLQRRARTPNTSLCPIPRPASDVWSTFASLAAYLSEIAPRAAAPWFLSYLHAPEYFSAYDAVRAALSQLALTSPAALPPEVVGILEAVYNIPFEGEDDESEQLRSCVGAADANASDVMDLMDVLADLRCWPDYEAARMGERVPLSLLADLEVSLPRSPASAPTSRPTTPAPPTRAVNANRLTRPPPAKAKTVRAVPGSTASASPFPAAHELHLPASSNWGGTAVQAKHSGNWRAAPSTNRTSSGAGKKRAAPKPPSSAGPSGIGIGYTSGKGNTGAIGNAVGKDVAAEHFAHADNAWSKRRAAMLAATAQFQSGPKHLQRQVAGFYRLRARELADDARAHSLDGARVLVSAQLERNGAQIDLHHRTVAEATTLATEAVDRWWARGGGGRFVVITGKGLHSAGQRGVLGPAVAAALRAAGWRVEEHAGYLTVRGR